jgi:Tol biopolymer transport system component
LAENGQRILYRSDRGGDIAIYQQRADGTGAVERLTKPEPGETHGPDSWVGRQQSFLYAVLRFGDSDVWMYSFENRKAVPVVAIPASAQNNGFLSPDGRWLA